MSWALTFEQAAYLLDTCDLYERSRTVTNGTPQDEGWELVATGVPYYHHQTDNIFEHTAVGEAVKPSLMVTDHAIFPQGVPLIGNPANTRAQMFRNTTPDSPLNGWFSILGPARQIPTLGIFETNEQQVLIRAAEFAPNVDSAALAAGTVTPGVPGFTSVPLAWAAAVDGTGPYLYQVQYRRTGDLDWLLFGGESPALAATVTGLTPGQAYDFQIVATDQLGATAPSSVAQVTTPATLAATLTSPSNTYNSVSLSLAVTGGTAPYSILFQYKLHTSATWLNWGTASAATTATITPLREAAQYDFQALVTDAAGRPLTSNLVTVTTGVFNFAGLGTLVAHYDFSVPGNAYVDSGRTTLVAADGDPVGSATDVSGNGNHASQATAGKRPTWHGNVQNGKGGILLDEVDDFLNLVNATAPTGNFTIVVVGNFTVSAAAQRAVICRAFNADTLALYLNNNKAKIIFAATGTASVTSTVNATGAPVMLTAYRSNTQLHVRTNGADDQAVSNSGTVTYPGGDQFAIGGQSIGTAAANVVGGYVFEVLLYAPDVTTPNLTTLETYLKGTKWSF